MSAFVCLVQTNGQLVPELMRSRFGYRLASGNRRLLWQGAGSFWCAASTGSQEEHPVITSTGSLRACGLVRLDNRDELMKSLPSNPNASDLEVAVNVIERRGTAAVADLLGDFSLIVWNERNHELLAARDAFGVKTLFYSQTAHLIALSSQGSLLAEGDSYDSDYLLEFLLCANGLLDRAIYAGVRAVPPAHCLTIRNGSSACKRFWLPPEWTSREPAMEPQEAATTFRRLFEHSIELRLKDGKEAWANLSGGLDSSSVVSVAQSLLRDGRIHRGIRGTATFVDELGDGDEREFSEEVLRRWGVANETIANYGLWHDDGEPPPFADEPQPVYLFYARDRQLSNLVRRAGGQVLLSGQGSDHYLTGNLFFLADWFATGQWGRCAREAARWAIIGRTSFWQFAFENAIRPLLPLRSKRRTVPGATIPNWVKSRSDASDLVARLPVIRSLDGPLGHKFASEVRYQLQILPIGMDRLSVYAGLDVRYPFLYRPLVEFSLRLPHDLKTRPYERKWIQREAMRGILPERVRTRRGKGGIDARVLWSLNHERARVHSLLDDPILAQLGVVDRDELSRVVARAQEGDAGSYGEIMAPLALETWLQVRAGRYATREVGQVASGPSALREA